MKKLLYLSLILPVIFSSCSKEEDIINNSPTTIEGCIDQDAANYNANATVNDGTCTYNIAGSVWNIITHTIDGFNALESTVHMYYWENGDYGEIKYDNTGNIISYAGGPGINHFNTWPEDNTLTLYEGLGDTIVIFEVDFMTDNDHMTLRNNSSGETIFKLERTSEPASTLESWEWRKERQIQSSVWEATSITINESIDNYDTQLYYFFEDGTVGIQVRNDDWPPNTSNNYPEALTLSMTPYKMTHISGLTIEDWNVDVEMTPGINNMTLTYQDFPLVGDTYIITLVRSTIYSLTDW